MPEPEQRESFLAEGKNHLIFALDVPDAETALRLVDRLRDAVGVFKVGLELFTAAGPDLVRRIVSSGARVFLDLKYHDIPATVRRAAAVAGSLDVSYLTVHASDGPDILSAAVEGTAETGKPEILAITVLTSVKPETVPSLGVNLSLEELVLKRARFAVEAGAKGLVCSPREVAHLRKHLGSEVLLITPGVRPSGPEVKGDDQARTATPGDAVTNGADMVVVGRPIRDAEDPLIAAENIAVELGEALHKKKKSG